MIFPSCQAVTWNRCGDVSACLEIASESYIREHQLTVAALLAFI
jgi:hypothetical protein